MKMRIKQTVALVIEARNECNRLDFEAVAKLYGRDLNEKHRWFNYIVIIFFQ